MLLMGGRDGKFMEQKRKQWDKEREEEEKKERKIYQKKLEVRGRLIKKVLEEATPMQLIRVRRMLSRRLGVYGWYSASHQINAVLRALDDGRYDDPNIADDLSDDMLDIAMSDTHFEIDTNGSYVTNLK